MSVVTSYTTVEAEAVCPAPFGVKGNWRRSASSSKPHRATSMYLLPSCGPHQLLHLSEDEDRHFPSHQRVAQSEIVQDNAFCSCDKSKIILKIASRVIQSRAYTFGEFSAELKASKFTLLCLVQKPVRLVKYWIRFVLVGCLAFTQGDQPLQPVREASNRQLGWF